jgi:hypothetical protein
MLETTTSCMLFSERTGRVPEAVPHAGRDGREGQAGVRGTGGVGQQRGRCPQQHILPKHRLAIGVSGHLYGHA